MEKDSRVVRGQNIYSADVTHRALAVGRVGVEFPPSVYLAVV